MKYKIEIWQNKHITETYESDKISDVLNWYKVKWRWLYESCDCSFTVYKDDEELSFEEESIFGFYR